MSHIFNHKRRRSFDLLLFYLYLDISIIIYERKVK
nr:MAG TPA: hypothetical protein [Caudoviricetes sp.]